MMHSLQMLFENCDIKCFSYSGRSMYGKRCLAVDGPIGSVLSELVLSLEGEDHNTFEEVSKAIGSFKTDSLGMGTVVYFPGVEYTESEGVDDNDDCETDGSFLDRI